LRRTVKRRLEGFIGLSRLFQVETHDKSIPRSLGGYPDGLCLLFERHNERIRKLYEWGDKPEEEYLAESREIKEELSHITPEEQRPDILAQFQRFLVDVSAAWGAASQEQRNRLARQLFDILWVKKERVVAVRP